MTPDEALKKLATSAEEYRRAKEGFDALSERVIADVIAARLAGATPTQVDAVSPLTPAYNRRKARDAGIPPARLGGGAAPKKRAARKVSPK